MIALQGKPAVQLKGGRGGNAFFSPKKDTGDSSDDDDDLSDLFCPLTLELMTDPVVCAGRVLLVCMTYGTKSLQIHFLPEQIANLRPRTGILLA